MIFVPRRREAADWYADFFGVEIQEHEHPDHFFLQVGPHQVWFHLQDEKSTAGAGGQVAYWRVKGFSQALAHALQMGARLYRGPLKRLDGMSMCQVLDPYGNPIGLLGP
jgi:predicted enzyme related to lactoylglutathione lyase